MQIFQGYSQECDFHRVFRNKEEDYCFNASFLFRLLFYYFIQIGKMLHTFLE